MFRSDHGVRISSCWLPSYSTMIAVPFLQSREEGQLMVVCGERGGRGDSLMVSIPIYIHSMPPLHTYRYSSRSVSPDCLSWQKLQSTRAVFYTAVFYTARVHGI